MYGFNGILPQSDVVMDGTNYVPWRLTVKLLLDGIRVLHHVDGTASAPVSPTISDPVSSDLETSALLTAFEQKMDKWAAEDSVTKMLICQTVTIEVRSQIAHLPTARDMWEYLEQRYCGSSQTQLYTLFQALGTLQQGDDTVDQFYSRYTWLWRQIDALTPPYCSEHLSCSASCAKRRKHDETRRMYEFIMRLRPEFESTRAQLLHAPSAYTLDEAFTFVRAEETHLRTSFPGGSSALVSRFPVTPLPTSSSPPLTASSGPSRPSSRPKQSVTCHYCGIVGHLERHCRKKQRRLPRQPPFVASQASPLLPPPSTTISPTDQQLLALFRQFQQTHLADSSSTGQARSAQVAPPTSGSQWDGDWSWPSS